MKVKIRVMVKEQPTEDEEVAYNLKIGETRCSSGLCCNHNTLIHN